MPPSALVIFAISLAINIASAVLLRPIGKFRHGIDGVLFCAIMAGYFYGVKAGVFYGALSAMSLYALNLAWISYALYVIPLNAAAGALASFLSSTNPLGTAALYVLVFYHVISFAITMLGYRSVGPGYIIFIFSHSVFTYLLISLFAGI